MSVQVTAHTGKKPLAVEHLTDWQYLERSFQRLICAWGRWIADWPDKVALSRHVWEQAEAVQKIRDRLCEFPGTTHNAEALADARLEAFANAILLAPSHEDALDGIYQVLLDALARSYIGYVERTHAVHDAPGIAIVRDLLRIKEQQRTWFREYRRRRPHRTNPAYLETLETHLKDLGDFQSPIPVETPAKPAGVATDFRLLARARHPRGAEPKFAWTPFMDGDFAHDLEARRLFWCYGYMLEMNLAEDQLRWIYHANDHHWDFIRDLSRHLWDESRHGDSGRSRLLDFGLDFDEVGYAYYGNDTPPNFEGPNQHDLRVDPLGDEGLYESVFGIGMIAETSHFRVKREAYDDFKAAGDLESAEMVLFDIVDETAHVQYAHRWLPMLAERAGKDPEEFRPRGAEARETYLRNATERQQKSRALPRDPAEPNFAHYQKLLQRLRSQVPLDPTKISGERAYLPM